MFSNMKHLQLGFFLLACMATTCLCGPVLSGYNGYNRYFPGLCKDRFLAEKGKLYVLDDLKLPNFGLLLSLRVDVCLDLNFKNPIYVVVFAKIDDVITVQVKIKVEKSYFLNGVLEIVLAEPIIWGPDFVLGFILEDTGRLPFIKRPDLSVLGALVNVFWFLLPPRIDVYVSQELIDVDLLVKGYTIDLDVFVRIYAVYVPSVSFCGIGSCMDLGDLIGLYPNYAIGY